VLAAFCQSIGQPERRDEVIAARDEAIAASIARGNDADDYKSAAGQFYNEVRTLCGLTSSGNTSDAFLADTLAPLIRPPMTVYQELESTIFG